MPADADADAAQPPVAGLLLAAGAGRRYGQPKALAHGGEWLRHAIGALRGGGCAPIRVVIGARAADAVNLLPEPDMAVVADDWDTGLAASLRAGLRALALLDRPRPVAALVHLVDLPDVGATVVRRLAALAAVDALARATYAGRPGHPVLLGRAHWAAVAQAAAGDRGAGGWLATRADLVLVECGDIAHGRDVDANR
jgi:CTP:molybdopterin cytidylyltransferase MocA